MHWREHAGSLDTLDLAGVMFHSAIVHTPSGDARTAI
jgi:hypothetical protein